MKKKEIREETPEERRKRLMSEIEEIGEKRYMSDVGFVRFDNVFSPSVGTFLFG